MYISRTFSKLSRVHQEVGIEVEVEGSNLPSQIPGWRTTSDGSLRGESHEYVLEHPVERSEVDKVLNALALAYKKRKTVVNDSDRAGIHVHVNMQDYTITKTFNTIILYLLFEDIYSHYCGPSREGNLFCLRIRDAEYLLELLETSVATNNFDILNTDDIRYASINLKALAVYGSLEFRTLRGTADTKRIANWVDMLLLLKDRAMMFDNPLTILDKLSEEGTGPFAHRILGEYAPSLLVCPDWEASIEASASRLQLVALAGNWTELNFCDEPCCDC